MVTVRLFSLFCLLFTMWVGCVFADHPEDKQDDTATLANPKVLSLEPHKGFIIIHSEDIRNIKNSYPTGFDLSVSIHDNTASAWQTCNCYPRTGLAFSFFDFDNQRVLGRGYLLSFYIEPHFELGKGVTFSMKGTSGLGYLTKPFDEKTNPDNRSYSLYVNGYLQLKAGLNYRINPRWTVSLSANYNHISNGGIEEPNKGINFPTASAGVDYTFNPQRFPKREKISPDTVQLANNWEVNSFVAYKELSHGAGERFFIYGVQGFYNHPIHQLHSLRVGAEWIINRAVKAKMRKQGEQQKLFKHHRGNLLAGHAFLLGRFRFSEQIGVYLFRPFNDHHPVYQRYSLTYRITDRIQAGIGLKSHLHVADFLDVRLGMRF